MRLKEGEDIDQYMGKLKEMAKKAYTEFDDPVREQLVMQQFALGVPQEIKKLMYLHATELQTSEKMLERCKLFMQIQGVSTGGACAQVSLEESKLDMVLRRVEALSVEVAGIKTVESEASPCMGTVQTRKPSGEAGFRGSCYKCGSWGHMARYCRREKSSQSPCGLCNNSGHTSSECALKVRRGCKRCGNEGHDEQGCKYKGPALNWQ